MSGELTMKLMTCCFIVISTNLKIISVPHVNEKESAEETVDLCVKLFSGIGVDVSISDIDFADRLTQRNTQSSNGPQRRQPNSVICMFTRRLVCDKVLAARNNASQLTVYNLELQYLLMPQLIGLN